MKIVVWAVLAMLGLAVLLVAPAQAAAPPVSAFGRMPAIESAVISPDGSRVALLGGPPEGRIIFLAPVDGRDSVTVKLGLARVNDIRWVGNAYLVVNFTMLDKGTDYSNGREYAYSLNRNVVIDMQGKLVASLLANTEWSRYIVSQPVLGVIEGPPATAFILGLEVGVSGPLGGLGSRVQPTGGDGLVFALWQVDVATGKARVAEKGNALTQGWDLDAAGVPRVRLDYDGDSDEVSYFIRGKGRSGWSALAPLTPGGAIPDFLGYSDPDDSIYLAIHDARGVHVVRRVLADGAVTPVALDKPVHDLGLQWDPFRIVPVAIVTEAERPSYQWLDPQLAAVHGRLSRAFAGRHVQLASWSRDKALVVVRVDAPDSLPAWFLFDTRTNQASSLGESYPELAGAALGKTSWIPYKARDGLEIPAYLTLPPGYVEGDKPPLIVMPHGGPTARDSFAFDWWVQALATRGYAVLQPQFRGSAGFGDAFQRAGYGEWGGKMQTDLIDGVMFLEGKGTIDRNRVAIVGASYGGYAALFGATVYPTAYRCAVSVNGVSDLGLFIGSKRRAYGSDTSLVNSLITMMGGSAGGPEALRVASPVARVTSQTAPILLIHGQDDTTVPFEQSRSMQRILKGAGKPGDLVVLKGDDHHLSSSETRTQMLTAMFAFLDRCLPVGA